MAENNNYEAVYAKGKTTGNIIATIGNIGGLIAATKHPGIAIPTMLGSEIAGEAVGHFGINKAFRESLEEQGIDFKEKPSDPNAIARTIAGSLVATGLPLAHAAHVARDGIKELGTAAKGLTKTEALGAGYMKGLSKPKNLIASILIPLIGAYMAPHISKAVAGDPFEGHVENGDEDNELIGMA